MPFCGWNTMFSALAQHGLGEEAIQIFDDMMLGGTKPNRVTLFMACLMGAIVVQSTISIAEKESFERHLATFTSCRVTQSCNLVASFSRRFSTFGVNPAPFLSKSCETKRHGWSIIAFALDTGGSPGTPERGGQNSLNGENGGLGQTRLGRIVGGGGKKLLAKLNEARKNFPMKIFLLLLGFYTANALATILGQTGDWDVLVAGVVVAAIEGIGMLMYKKNGPSIFNGRFKPFMVLVNYWKAGVCLGLFVDAFKLGS
ncbi:hypothetical protein GIB67_003857 [Kingdonia uniflora]|uniref:Ycf20-like protein n=1 Tax=Kingdonia uniflora TaxID=39325 RepID=A0A7J7NYA5_9MAGN|nr:hypothetical protein GIB67_003857 [Kingdonia uniflora]